MAQWCVFFPQLDIWVKETAVFHGHLYALALLVVAWTAYQILVQTKSGAVGPQIPGIQKPYNQHKSTTLAIFWAFLFHPKPYENHFLSLLWALWFVCPGSLRCLGMTAYCRFYGTTFSIKGRIKSDDTHLCDFGGHLFPLFLIVSEFFKHRSIEPSLLTCCFHVFHRCRLFHVCCTWALSQAVVHDCCTWALSQAVVHDCCTWALSQAVVHVCWPEPCHKQWFTFAAPEPCHKQWFTIAAPERCHKQWFTFADLSPVTSSGSRLLHLSPVKSSGSQPDQFAFWTAAGCAELPSERWSMAERLNMLRGPLGFFPCFPTRSLGTVG